MRFLIVLMLTILGAVKSHADAVIFSGNDVKALKYNLDLFGRSKVMATNSDPSTGAGLAAPLGSLAMDYLTGGAWIKTGGTDTAWSNIQVGLIDLTSDVTGVLPIANGGTNKNLTLSAGGMIWSDADSFEVLSAGTSGQALVSGGALTPSWFAPTLGSVLFAGASGALTQDNASLFFDDTNNRLGVGVAASENTVVIGGTTYGSTFSVHAEDGADLAEYSVHRHAATAAVGAQIVAVRSRGNEATETAVQSGDNLLRILSAGHDGTDYELAAEIRTSVDGTPGAGDMPGAISFLVSPDGSATPAQAMKIANNKILTFNAYGAGVLQTDAGGVVSSSAVDLTTSITGTLPVANGGTGITSGTSGGVLAFTAAGTIASSNALTANQLVIGGGAGAAPSTLAAGSQHQVLRMGAANPAYGSIDLSQSAAVGTSVLAVANGGTGLSTIAAQRIPFASATDTYSTDSNLVYNSAVPSRLYLGAPGTTSGKFNVTNTNATIGGIQINNATTSFGIRIYTQTTGINAELANASSTASEGALIHLNRSRGTNAARTQTVSGDNLGKILFNGYTSGSAFGTVGAAGIYGYASEDQTATAQGGELRFTTTANTTIVPKERLIITNNGELRLMGSTSGYVGIQPPAAPTSYTVTMPGSQGNTDTYLRNDGAGNLTWSTGYNLTTDLTLDPSDTLNIQLSTRIQVFRVQGNAGAVTLSTTPFGAPDPLDGTLIELIGNSDTNTVSITYNDAAGGAVGNFSTITLHKYEVAQFRYNATLDRYIYVP